MNTIDYAILGLTFISAAIGIWRGFIREAVSVAVWVTAFGLAYSGADVVGGYFEGLLSDHSARVVVGFVVLFLLVHIAGFVVARLLSKIVKTIGLSSVDRVAGVGFGVVRAFVIVAVVVLLAGMTPLMDSPTWHQSYMVGIVSDILTWIQARYPLSLPQSFTPTSALEMTK